MRNPLHTSFVAVFQNEILLNSKRVAPYVLMLLFIVNALMWSVRGAAVTRGWATNSDFNIARNILAFSWFLGLPIFNAVIMGDPVLRDFRLGVDSLIFSKPISRASYLIGKFLGSFFVFVCCMSTYVLSLIVMQVVHTSAMIVLPVRVPPYFKHFFFFAVISHLLLAAIYFSVATLTRSTKLVYGLAVSVPVVYLGSSFLEKGLPVRWRLVLDPFWFSSIDLMIVAGTVKPAPAFIDQYIVSYSPDFFINRGVLILGAVVCLTILCRRFTVAERTEGAESFSILALSTGADRVYYDPSSIDPTSAGQVEKRDSREKVLLPSVTRASEGWQASLNKLIAALGVEFRLLLSERSLVVIMPLAIVLSTLDVAFWSVAPKPSLSAAYAGHTAKSLLLFLLGITIFYTGEAMHRDRDLRIEPLLWGQPAPNYALLLSKFLATLMLTVSLILLVGVITITLQILKHNGPIEISAYLRIYCIILVPNAIFMAAAALVLNVLLRDRYLTYAAAISTCSGLFYFYSQGHNHWLYNPLLFQLWDYGDLIGGANHSRILDNRLYILILSFLFIKLAHLSCQRNST
jgi:ABC-2 type transport system permease protein